MKVFLLVRTSLIGILIYIINSAYADTINNPCGGPSALLNIVDRPTVGDSACVVPYKNTVLEAGYEYQQLISDSGYQQNLPEAEFRLGLPSNNEFVFVLPNYIHQSMSPSSGFTAATVGIKHEIGYNANWLTTIETLVTMPSGSTAFGSNGLGAALNGIVNYTFNSQYSLSFMLGGTTQTQSSLNGGQRFSSINPDVVFTDTLTEKLALYGEVYGQSNTGPGQGSGFNMDGGFLYLVLPNFSVDAELGQRIGGSLSGFEHYIGTGLAVMF